MLWVAPDQRCLWNNSGSLWTTGGLSYGSRYATVQTPDLQLLWAVMGCVKDLGKVFRMSLWVRFYGLVLVRSEGLILVDLGKVGLEVSE